MAEGNAQLASAGEREAAGNERLAAAGEREAAGGERVARSNEQMVRDQDRQTERDRMWPYDFLALQEQATAKQGGGVKVEGGLGGGSGTRGNSGGGTGAGRMSRAAAGLGSLASGLARSAPYAARQDIDPNTGQVMFDSRYGYRQQPSSYLDQGQLVHPGQKAPQGFDPNGADAANAWAYGKDGPYQQGPTNSGGEDVGMPVGRDYGGNTDPVPDADYGGGGHWYSGITNAIGGMFGSGGASSQGGSDYGEE